MGDQAPSSGTYDPKVAIEPHILAKLDPEWLAIFTKRVNEHPAPTREEMTIEAIRANPTRLAAPCALDTKGYPRTAEKEFTSEDGAKIPVRVYYPDETKYGSGPYPVHLNFHGGGFVLGDLANESTLCQSMCDGAGVVVVDVNYRHCPETIWGKSIQDSWAAVKWVRSEADSLNVTSDSISLSGISAGGHTILILQHLARDQNIPLKLIMATVPSATDALDYKEVTDSPFPSFQEFEKGPVLPWLIIKWFGTLTRQEDKLEELHRLWPAWWFAPLNAENFKDLCPTFIRTAECDPLRDEGEAYALKLAQAGNKVTLKRYQGSVHTFMFWPGVKAKEEYDLDSIEALKAAHRVD